MAARLTWLPAVVALVWTQQAAGKAVESFQIVMGNEAHVADGSDVLYYENLLWLQKSWSSFSRTKHTLYFGTELLVEPMVRDYTGSSRFGVDTLAGFVGYKSSTYLPDWYNFNIRLRIPLAVPPDPFGMERCEEEPEPGFGSRWEPVTPPRCAPHREYVDRLKIELDPLLVKKSWNLFTLYDRNRVTATLYDIEYSNKIKLISTTPDLEFPIAMYVGDEIRLRKNLREAGGRTRNDFIVGLASNFFDWVHLGLEAMYHLDSKAEASESFLVEIYLELYFEIFFDNTFGKSDKAARQVFEEARD